MNYLDDFLNNCDTSPVDINDKPIGDIPREITNEEVILYMQATINNDDTIYQEYLSLKKRLDDDWVLREIEHREDVIWSLCIDELY